MMKVRMRERGGVKGDSWGWNLQRRIGPLDEVDEQEKESTGQEGGIAEH